MKLFDILGKVGGAIVKTVVPGGGLIVDLVNEFMPADKKLPSGATGSDMQAAVDGLPADQRAQLMDREFDVEEVQIRESNDTLRTMLESDAKSPHTTRPKIAYQSFQVVAFSNVVAISIWAWAVINSADPLESVTNGWPFILAITGTLTTLLLAYFGILKQEHKNRLDAATGSTPAAGGGILSGLIKKVVG